MPSVLITGCSTGIGRASAELFAERGYHVVATARRLETLADLDVDLRLVLDVTDSQSIAAAIQSAGQIDVLVNNAGLSLWSPIELCPPDQFERMFQTNVVGGFLMSQAALPTMRAKGWGRIVQISSGAARRGSPVLGVYAATKIAFETFSEALRYEVRQFGIDVVVVQMGAVTTNISENRTVIEHHGSAYEDLVERQLRWMAERRAEPATARDVAEVIWRAVTMDDPPFRMYVGAQLQQQGETQQIADAEHERFVYSAMYGTDTPTPGSER